MRLVFKCFFRCIFLVFEIPRKPVDCNYTVRSVPTFDTVNTFVVNIHSIKKSYAADRMYIMSHNFMTTIRVNKIGTCVDFKSIGVGRFARSKQDVSYWCGQHDGRSRKYVTYRRSVFFLFYYYCRWFYSCKFLRGIHP